MSRVEQFVQLAIAEVSKPGAQAAQVRGSVPGSTRKPTNDELDAYFRESKASNAFDPSAHWCGIFAVSMLRRAGVRCHWVVDGGIFNDLYEDQEDLEITTGADAQKGIQYGDVLVREPNHHHIIVLEPVTAGTIRCVEGNAQGVGSPLLAMNWGGNMANNCIANVNTRYRIKG
jgi:hypothetical protein